MHGLIGVLIVVAAASDQGSARAVLEGAHALYRQRDYLGAAQAYEEAIGADPALPAAYFFLASSYDNLYRPARTDDTSVYTRLAGLYNRAGDFDKTIEVLGERARLEPLNPEAHYTMATYYWDKAYRDFRLSEGDKRMYVEHGLEAVDRALGLNADYMEALVYKNLLLRLMANLEKDPSRLHQLLEEADRLRDRAQEIRRKKG